MLAEELAKLKRPTLMFITHLESDEIELTMQEVEECAVNHKPEILRHNRIFMFYAGKLRCVEMGF